MSGAGCGLRLPTSNKLSATFSVFIIARYEMDMQGHLHLIPSTCLLLNTKPNPTPSILLSPLSALHCSHTLYRHKTNKQQMDPRLPTLPLLLGRNARSANLSPALNFRPETPVYGCLFRIYRVDFVFYSRRMFDLPSLLDPHPPPFPPLPFWKWRGKKKGEGEITFWIRKANNKPNS